MNREETKKAIEVMQAYVDGKTVQINICNGWSDRHTDVSPVWDWLSRNYRIKPTKPRTGDLMVCVRPNEGYIQSIELTPEVKEALKAAGIEY